MMTPVQIAYYSGTSGNRKRLKVWDGVAWTAGLTRVWNGTAWI